MEDLSGSFDPRQAGSGTLGNIFDHAFRASNRPYQRYEQQLAGLDDYEETPIKSMMGRSPIVGYARQALPANVGETGLGEWVANQAQRISDSHPAFKAEAQRASALAARIPLGGFSQEEKTAYSEARALPGNADLRRETVEYGKVPDLDNMGEAPSRGAIRANLAQGAGVVAGDMASDGLRNIWWFINAPQALAALGSEEAARHAGAAITGSNKVPVFQNRSMRMAATLPAVIATSAGIGNFGRPEGYKAIIPSEEDPRVSANPLAEVGARYFLGRSGGLLPYSEFVKERPDVSIEEYNAYKDYLFSNKSPIKAKVDGIHGPEVNFMGKSIPLLGTGVPLAAAIGGSMYGMRRAGRALKGRPDLLEARNAAKQDWKSKQSVVRSAKADLGDEMDRNSPELQVAQRDVDESYNSYRQLQNDVEGEVLTRALGYGSAGAIAGGATASALESVIRSLKPQHTAEES
jgi:hypothetical protein